MYVCVYACACVCIYVKLIMYFQLFPLEKDREIK